MATTLGRILHGGYNTHTEAIKLQFLIFKTMIREFEKLGDGCKYDWTIKEIADGRLHAAKCIRHCLRIIRKEDKKAYEAVRIVFYDEIAQALAEIKQHQA